MEPSLCLYRAWNLELLILRATVDWTVGIITINHFSQNKLSIQFNITGLRKIFHSSGPISLVLPTQPHTFPTFNKKKRFTNYSSKFSIGQNKQYLPKSLGESDHSIFSVQYVYWEYLALSTTYEKYFGLIVVVTLYPIYLGLVL